MRRLNALVSMFVVPNMKLLEWKWKWEIFLTFTTSPCAI